MIVSRNQFEGGHIDELNECEGAPLNRKEPV